MKTCLTTSIICLIGAFTTAQTGATPKELSVILADYDRDMTNVLAPKVEILRAKGKELTEKLSAAGRTTEAQNISNQIEAKTAGNPVASPHPDLVQMFSLFDASIATARRTISERYQAKLTALVPIFAGRDTAALLAIADAQKMVREGKLPPSPASEFKDKPTPKRQMVQLPPIAEGILGKWQWTSVTKSTGSFTIKPDGTLFFHDSIGGDTDFVWEIDGQFLKFSQQYKGKSTRYKLPVRDGKLKGTSQYGNDLEAIKLPDSSSNGTSATSEPKGKPTHADELSFDTAQLPKGWEILALKGSSIDFTTTPGFATITCAPTHTIYPKTNTDAPRLVQKVSGDFIVETRMTLTNGPSYTGGGILVFDDPKTFIRLERATSNAGQGIEWGLCEKGVYRWIAPIPETPVKDMTVDLRLARKSKVITASWKRPEETDWRLIRTANITLRGQVQVGICLGNGHTQPISMKFDWLKLATY